VICADAAAANLATYVRIIVVLAAPDASARFAAADLNMDLRQGLWFSSHCLAHAHHAADTTNALTLTDEQILTAPSASLAAMLRHLALDLPADEERVISETFVAALKGEPQRLDAAIEEAMGKALAVFDRRTGGAGWWSRDLFSYGDRPDETCPELIDVTGRARILVFGPYLTLPAGRWRATVEFELCRDSAKRPYLIEFGAGADFSRVETRATGAQRATVSVEHQFAAPAPVEIRIWLARAAFHGSLAFAGAKIEAAA
jgi:hypothetical protein